MNTKKLITQIKRELWENKIRFVYAPIVVTVLLIGIMSIGVVKLGMSFAEGGVQFHGGATIGHGSSNDSRMDVQSMLAKIASDGSDTFNMVVSGVTYANTSLLTLLFLFVLLAYAHSCLFDDRKNKDILFWRSLPVSETSNVLVKLGFILLYAPLMVLVLNLIVGIVALIVATVFFTYHGAQLGGLLAAIVHSNVASIAFSVLLSNLLGLLLLLPVIGFTMLSSAWAKKSPFLFSSVLPVGLVILDKISQEWFAINLRVIDTLIAYWAMFTKAIKSLGVDHISGADQSMVFDPHLATGLLISIVIGSAFIAGSIWLRNNRYEI